MTKINLSKTLLSSLILLSGAAQAELTPYNYNEVDQAVMLYHHAGGHLSQNGRFLTYYAGYPAGSPSLYRWDRYTDTRMSIGADLTAGNQFVNGAHDVSSDGNILVFHTTVPLVVDDTDTASDSYILDFETGAIELASQTTGFVGTRPVISADGRYVLDVYDQALNLYDFQTKTHSQIWQGSDISAEISGDGSVIVIVQHGNIYVLEPETGTYTQLDTVANVKGFNLSEDGRFIVYSEGPVHGDVNHALHLFDRKSEITSTLVSGSKVSATQAISGDGRFVVFSTDDGSIVPNAPNTNLYNIIVFDRLEHSFALVNSRDDDGNVAGGLQALSADGHYITLGRSGSNGGGYVVKNPLYSPGYCEGYTEFTAN